MFCILFIHFFLVDALATTVFSLVDEGTVGRSSFLAHAQWMKESLKNSDTHVRIKCIAVVHTCVWGGGGGGEVTSGYLVIRM